MVAAALEVEEMVKSFVNLPAPGTTEGKGGGGGGGGGERREVGRTEGSAN